MNKTIIWMLVFFCLASFVAAAPPVQFNDDTEHLHIIYPKNDAFPQNENFSMHFHILNSSAYTYNTTDVDCIIHIYNGTNKHLLEADLLQDSNGIDLKAVIDTNITGTRGIYPYVVLCNATNGEAGFVSTRFKITPDGSDEQPSGLVVWAILIPFLIGLFFLMGSAILDKKDHVGIKIGLFLLSLVTFFASFYLATISLIHFYHFEILENAIANTMFWYSWAFFVILAYFIFYIIAKAIAKAAQDKQERLNY